MQTPLNKEDLLANLEANINVMSSKEISGFILINLGSLNQSSLTKMRQWPLSVLHLLARKLSTWMFCQMSFLKERPKSIWPRQLKISGYSRYCNRHTGGCLSFGRVCTRCLAFWKVIQTLCSLKVGQRDLFMYRTISGDILLINFSPTNFMLSGFISSTVRGTNGTTWPHICANWWTMPCT